MKKFIFIAVALSFLNCKEKKKETVKTQLPVNIQKNPFSKANVNPSFEEKFLDSLEEKNPNLYKGIKEILGQEYMEEMVDEQTSYDDDRDYGSGYR